MSAASGSLEPATKRTLCATSPGVTPDYPDLFAGFEAACDYLHPYSEHRHLDDASLETYQAQVRRFINDMLTIAARMPE